MRPRTFSCPLAKTVSASVAACTMAAMSTSIVAGPSTVPVSELYVPQTVNVVVKSRSFIGGVGNKTRSIDHGKANSENQGTVPCLYIIANKFLGGVDIKN